MIKTLTNISRQAGRRRVALAIAPIVVAAGLLSRVAAAPALVRENVGDGLYAVLVWALVTVAVPKQTPAFRALLAFAACAAIEALQAVPSAPGSALAALRQVPFAALVLGRGFSVADLARYAVGAAIAGAGEAVLGRSSAGDEDKREGDREGES